MDFSVGLPPPEEEEDGAAAFLRAEAPFRIDSKSCALLMLSYSVIVQILQLFVVGSYLERMFSRAGGAAGGASTSTRFHLPPPLSLYVV